MGTKLAEQEKELGLASTLLTRYKVWALPGGMGEGTGSPSPHQAPYNYNFWYMNVCRVCDNRATWWLQYYEI
jgi:hypothetical protein